MTAEGLSRLLTVIAFIGSAVTILVFIILYQLLARWEDSNLGRHIMFFAGATFLVLVQSIVSGLWDDYPGKLFFRPAVYIAFWVVWVWRIKLFLKEQREAKNMRAAEQLQTVLRQRRKED